MGDEGFLFGKVFSIENGKDEIIKAVLELGKTADDKVDALVLEMNNAGFHQLFRDFMFRNQATIEDASTGINSYAHSYSQESTMSLLNTSNIFPLTTSTTVVVAVIDGPTVDTESTPHRLPTRNDK